MLVDLRSIRRVIMNREVLWRFNYKFPLLGFRLRKKERKNKTTTKKLSNNLFSLWFSLGLLLRLAMFPWKREQLWIYFVGTLSVWIFFFMFFVTKFSSIYFTLSSSISPDRQPVSVSHVFQNSNNSLFVISWLCLYQDLLTLQTNVSVDGNVE